MEFRLLRNPTRAVELPGVFGPPVRLSLEQVQWDQEMALIVDLGEQRSAGYAVRHLATQAVPNGMQVRIEVRRPAPGAMVAMAITHPACLVRIPRRLMAPGSSEVQVVDQAGVELARLRVDQP